MNTGLKLDFAQPQWLYLLLSLPVFWLLGFETLKRLGRVRRWLALLLRTVVVVLLVAALSQLRLQQTTDRLTVFFLLDQSDSIPADRKRFMMDYVSRAVAAHRREDRNDYAGAIVFGRDAYIEVAPYDGDLPLIGNLESIGDLKFDATNLESALKTAKASFVEGTAPPSRHHIRRKREHRQRPAHGSGLGQRRRGNRRDSGRFVGSERNLGFPGRPSQQRPARPGI